LLRNNSKFEKKFKNLTRVEPLHKNTYGFVGRNIADTGYISSLFMDFLQDYYKNSKIKVLGSNGKFTNYIRSKILRINKDRNDYSHHGVDAVCCALVGSLPKSTIDKIKWSTQHPESLTSSGDLINHSTGEVIFDVDNFKKDVGEAKLKDELNKKENFKYSTPLIKHATRALHKDTLYSGRLTKDGTKIEVISKMKSIDDFDKKKFDN
jgi:CRISPR/Cas system Type II protein with McrA/HNH and RuvC-like nuclease domain